MASFFLLFSLGIICYHLLHRGPSQYQVLLSTGYYSVLKKPLTFHSQILYIVFTECLVEVHLLTCESFQEPVFILSSELKMLTACLLHDSLLHRW